MLSNTQLLSTREVSDVEAAREQQGQLATRQGEQQVEFLLSAREAEECSLRAALESDPTKMRAQLLSAREGGGAKAEDALTLGCFLTPSMGM